MKTKFFILMALTAAACTTSVPETAKMEKRSAATFPEYDGAVIPPNIAPLNFAIEEDGEDFVTRIYTSAGEKDIVLGGKEVDIPLDDWQELLRESCGDTLYTEVYVKRSGEWSRFNVRKNPVAEEKVDSYITYRLIEPSYVDYEEMTLNQRNLTCFDERVLYNNMMLSDGDNGQCVNCHAVQDYNRGGRSQFHVRQNLGGTVITNGDEITKVNLKTEQTLSAGVYPAWHPSENLIAYSVNETGQVFHTRDTQKVEVLDFASDLILYDAGVCRVYDIDCRDDEFETFPAWSPDGKTLYYSSAHYERQTNDIDAELGAKYKELKYNIYKRSFDPRTMKFGEQDTVFNASAIGKSAVMPRISPDGKYLLFSMADYGNFHVWHKSGDLFALKLASSETEGNPEPQALAALNSPEAESWHAWSSNGRWILFSSRRMDGNYTRLYIAYFDKDGHAHTPFVVPQKSPSYYRKLFKSYNVPEWMVAPVQPSRLDYVEAVSGDARQAEYGGSALLSPTAGQRRRVDGATGASQKKGDRVGY